MGPFATLLMHILPSASLTHDGPSVEVKVSATAGSGVAALVMGMVAPGVLTAVVASGVVVATTASGMTMGAVGSTACMRSRAAFAVTTSQTIMKM